MREVRCKALYHFTPPPQPSSLRLFNGWLDGVVGIRLLSIFVSLIFVITAFEEP
jgi:hypothetical protein